MREVVRARPKTHAVLRKPFEPDARVWLSRGNLYISDESKTVLSDWSKKGAARDNLGAMRKKDQELLDSALSPETRAGQAGQLSGGLGAWTWGTPGAVLACGGPLNDEDAAEQQKIFASWAKAAHGESIDLLTPPSKRARGSVESLLSQALEEDGVGAGAAQEDEEAARAMGLMD